MDNMIAQKVKTFLLMCGLYRRPLYFENKIACRGGFFKKLKLFEFDPKFYADFYQDIGRSGIDPVEHYYYYGKSEGRLGVPFDIDINSYQRCESKDSVLIVSHELSKTGAPILAYNIAKELSLLYNVTVVALDGGSLHDEFKSLDINLYCVPGLRGGENISKYYFSTLNKVSNYKFAIINSIESASVLRDLNELDVPTVTLLHEFPSYSGGLDKFRKCIYWSTITLASSEFLKNEILKSGQLADTEKISILPQGKCIVPKFGSEQSVEATFDKPLNAIRVVGAGTITYRKGVDLFIESARGIHELAIDKKVEFIWIGKNVDSALGADYFQYLEDQVKRSGLHGCFRFVDERDDYEEILSTSDIFLLSSRLDPLPNVAIDSFAKRIPVFFFNDATGLSSILSNTFLESVLCAAYLNPADMALKVYRYISVEDKSLIASEIGKFYESYFNFKTYIKNLEKYAQEAILMHRDMVRDADFLRLHCAINDSFCNPKIWNLLGPEDKARRYVNTWKSNIYKYRPVPDFHPSIYRALIKPQGDPYAHYIKSGLPAGPWKNSLIEVDDSVSPAVTKLATALHIHCYYPELLAAILSRLSCNSSRVDIFVSTNTEFKKTEIQSIFSDFDLLPASIDVSPNIGRDIGPFLNVYSRRLSSDYDVIFHVHTKKSPHVDDKDGRNWYEYCLENLLGGIGNNVLDKILFEFNDDSLGLVYPSDPNAIGWGANYQFSNSVLGRLGLIATNDDFNFPIGTMFAASKRLISRLCDLNFNWDEYPPEPLPIDGTMLHAIERSIPIISENLGLHQKLVYVNSTTRL